MLEKMRTDDLLKDGGIMVFSTGIALFFAYLFHLYIARTLGPSSYGLYGSLLALFYIFSMLLGTLQTNITLFVSHYYASKNNV